MATRDFWRGFEKNAMTNIGIMKRYYKGLMSVLGKSKDPTDMALFKKYRKASERIDPVIRKRVRDMGEATGMAWRHNVNPSHVRKMVKDINANKGKPGWARRVLMRDLGEVL